jgi:hypothetical protein
MAIIDLKTSIEPLFMTARASGFLGANTRNDNGQNWGEVVCAVDENPLGKLAGPIVVQDNRTDLYYQADRSQPYPEDDGDPTNSNPVNGTTGDLITITGFKLKK